MFYLRMWVSLGLSVVCCLPSFAQNYPSKSITIVVAAPIGSPQDVLARTLGVSMGQLLGTTVVTDNRPGGRGSIGYGMVAKAAPDGSTLLLASNGFVIGKLVDRSLRYEPLRQFTPIALVATADMAFFVSKQTPVRSIAEFVRYAKAHPGKLTYLSPSIGSPQHLAMELFKLETGIKLLHIPYTDFSSAIMALVSNEIDAAINPYFGPLLQHAKAGEIRMLAVLSDQRMKDMPTVPTLKEAGYPNVDVHVWYGLLGPSGLPNEVVNVLDVAVNKALVSQNVGDGFKKQGLRLVGGHPQEFDVWLRAETDKWNRVVKAAGIKAE